ncbi:hypothetical protein V1477_019313 [Vespula maculifrons]|uniref:Uncharacterized protein n=2 Tax=Vespula TaxID=7451 RepID=A0A834MP59_VESVU|nr:hypothetical protein HZH66_014562 [Vespula vulgaris]
MGGFATTSLREIASLVWVSEKQKGSEGKGGGSGGVVALVGQLVEEDLSKEKSKRHHRGMSLEVCISSVHH